MSGSEQDTMEQLIRFMNECLDKVRMDLGAEDESSATTGDGTNPTLHTLESELESILVRHRNNTLSLDDALNEMDRITKDVLMGMSGKLAYMPFESSPCPPPMPSDISFDISFDIGTDRNDRLKNAIRKLEDSMWMGGGMSPKDVIWILISSPESENDHHMYDLLSENDHPDGLFCLGIMFLSGIGVERDVYMAELIFKKLNDEKLIHSIGHQLTYYNTIDIETKKNIMMLMDDAYETYKCIRDGGRIDVENTFNKYFTGKNPVSDNAFNILMQYANSLNQYETGKLLNGLLASHIEWSDEKLLSMFDTVLRNGIQFDWGWIRDRLQSPEAMRTFETIRDSYLNTNDTEILLLSLKEGDVLEHVILQRIAYINSKEMDTEQRKRYRERMERVYSMFPKYTESHQVIMY